MPEALTQKLFHRARISMPIFVILLNFVGAILFHREIPDRVTIWADFGIFLIWTIFVSWPLVFTLKSAKNNLSEAPKSPLK